MECNKHWTRFSNWTPFVLLNGLRGASWFVIYSSRIVLISLCTEADQFGTVGCILGGNSALHGWKKCGACSSGEVSVRDCSCLGNCGSGPNMVRAPSFLCHVGPFICRVVQSCIKMPQMTVYLMKSLQKIPYKHRLYMVLANSSYLT